MDKMIKWILIFMAGFLAIFYVAYENDDQNLGNNYFYLPKYEADDIGFPDGAIIYKSDKKYIFNDVKISGEIIDVAHDNSFILAVQETEKFNTWKTHNYYIIVIKTDSTYGPYTLEEYLLRRKELGVPDDLKLEVG